MKRVANAPSMTRWSAESDSGRIRRGTNSRPVHTGFITDLETPRMATSGALTIGENAVPPMPPTLEMVKQAPLMSAGPSLPSRAFLASSPHSTASWLTDF